ncbi:PP2C family protein-serine/threonine phosphatase [bacterium]|nr:PP2C family protein-serine/threonine phosphatase [bacterium]MBU1073605.1 PP2C family protein-serine/threonine phosphatase [bacterium]MBU1676790.1 PP2C family protein-serine/threonine phosphatase [bacterium]
MDKKIYRNMEEILRRIDASGGVEEMLREILRRIVGVWADDYGIESGRLYREGEDEYELIESVGEYGDAITGKTVPKSYALLRELERQRAVRITPETPGYDPDFEAQFSHFDNAAVIVGGAPAYIMSFGIRRQEDSGDLNFILQTIRTSVGLKLRQSNLESMLRQAQQIQQSLLPRNLPELPGFELAATSVPAEEVGGDVYDAQTVEDGVISLTVGDASGHGLPAALQARDLITGLRMGAADQHKISTTVQQLNRVIHQSGLVSRFISLFYGELEETGNLSFVNGGHCPPLLFATDGRVFELPSNGPVLGPLPDASYLRSFAYIRPGEILLMFTDGLIERERPAGDREQFGIGRLMSRVQELRDEPADAIVSGLLDTVRTFGGDAPWADDVTVFVVRRKPAAEFEPKSDLYSVSANRRSPQVRLVKD